MKIFGTITPKEKIQGRLTEKLRLEGSLSASVKPPEYKGAYDITPTDEIQTIPVSQLLMTKDITVNPVPSNYGRIAWNGSELSVY